MVATMKTVLQHQSFSIGRGGGWDENSLGSVQIKSPTAGAKPAENHSRDYDAKDKKEKETKTEEEKESSREKSTCSRSPTSLLRWLWSSHLRTLHLVVIGNQSGQSGDTFIDSQSELLLFKPGLDDGVQNSAGPGIGDSGLQSITNLNPKLSLFSGHQEKNTVIFLFLSDAPFFEEFYRILFNGQAFQAFYGDYSDLSSGLTFQIPNQLISKLFVARIDHVGEVVDIADRFRKMGLISRSEKRKDKEHYQGEEKHC